MREEETIIGQKITSVRKLTPEDYEREGWDHDRFAIGAVLVLENGKLAADESPDQFAERMGLQPTLRIVLDQEFIQEATDLLTDSGFDASRNGHGVRVRLESPEKGRPIEALVRAGIEVSDFELEGGEEWSDD